MSEIFMIKFQAKETASAEFLELMLSVKQDLPRVEGCEGVIVLRQTDDPARFILLETWRNREFHDANTQKLIQAGAWDHLKSLLVAEPEGSYLKQL